MCVDETQMLLMEFHSSFMHLVTVHTKFHPHETLLFFFFLNYMPYYHFCLCGMSFNKNETHETCIENGLSNYKAVAELEQMIEGTLAFNHGGASMVKI